MERMHKAMAYYGPHGGNSKIEGSLGMGFLLMEVNPEDAFESQPIRGERGLVFKHEHHLEFVHSQTGCLMELHWCDQWETPDMTRASWDRSIPSVWQDCSIQLMSPQT